MSAAVLLPALVLAAPAAPRPDARLEAVVDLFYDLRFEEALEAARAFEAAEPGHPAGPFYRSLVHYQRFLLEDPPSEATLAAFEAARGQAQAAAEAWGEPAVSQYYLGAAKGFAARIRLAQGRLVASIPLARSAAGHLEEALERDPSLAAAELGLGLFDYYLTRVPAAARPLAYLLTGRWGNRLRGLERLRRAAAEGGPARMEARSVLAFIHSSAEEAAWQAAAPLLDELLERYPRTPRYRLRRAYVALRQARWEEALGLAAPDGPWLDALAPELRGRARAEALYRAAEARLLAGEPLKAAEPLARLGEPPGAFGAWVRLRRANLLEAAAGREAAAASYRAVEGDKGAEWAAKVQREGGFGAAPWVVMPQRWPNPGLPELPAEEPSERSR